MMLMIITIRLKMVWQMMLQRPNFLSASASASVS